jgi:hypothetical protein
MCAVIIYSFSATEVYFYTRQEGGDGAILLNDNDANARQEDRVHFLDEGNVWMVVVMMNAAWAVTFAVLLKLVKKEFRHTFFSLKTGRESTVDYFNSEDDAVKCQVFGDNRRLWKSIEKEVTEWVMDNWYATTLFH